jgi:hypothetical protein
VGAWPKGAAWIGPLALSVGSLALLGCQPPPGPAAAPPPFSCPAAVYDQAISVAATSTTMLIDTRATVHTASGTDGISVDITDNQGTVAFWGSGPVPAFLYKRIPWPDVNYTLLAGLGVTDGAWLPFWLYCASDGTLGRFYAERTDGTATLNQVITGSCNEVLGDWYMPVDVPAHSLRGIPLTCGFTVNAPSWDAPLNLGSSSAGTASINGLPATALVFSTTDCRTGCGSSSWFELHSILWQPSSGQVGFAIWYLAGDTAGTGVSAANGLLLPAAGWTDILHPMATWTLTR